MLVQLFEPQVEHCFMLSLKRIPTGENAVAGTISRPSREAIIRVTPAAFEVVWAKKGPFNVDLMACRASVSQPPLKRGGTALFIYTKYDRAGSAETDVFAKDVSILPDTVVPAFGFSFHPQSRAGYIVQHMAGCKAHPVALSYQCRKSMNSRCCSSPPFRLSRGALLPRMDTFSGRVHMVTSGIGDTFAGRRKHTRWTSALGKINDMKFRLHNSDDMDLITTMLCR